MRSPVILVAVLAVLAGMPLAAAGQPEPVASSSASAAGQGSGSGSGSGAASTPVSQTATTPKPRAEPEPGVKFVRALTNVQVELTITDQTGSAPPEKKAVSMVVGSGSWGKIRSAGTVLPRPGQGGPPVGVELNVDARPFVSVDGPIQLELALIYSPFGNLTEDSAKMRPMGMNQSLTVVLQNGKPLTVSQAADPVSDRKITVEVKATVLK